MKLDILVVDDDAVTRDLLCEVLTKDQYRVTLAESGEQALRLMRKQEYPIILSDIQMLEVGGVALLKEAMKTRTHSVVILMTGFGSMEGAIEAIQAGAFDYVSKPFKMSELKTLIARAAMHWQALQGEKIVTPHESFDLSSKTLIGRSSRIVEVYKTLARAALSSSTVLIVGESGTGKELIARAIHENGPKRGKRFVAVNCGALVETLLESELFGHLKGSFTGALQDKVGLFEEADGGTLFLDEIGDISPGLQVKLLRVLQEGEFKPVGANFSKKIQVRVIAATHRDLEMLVRQGRFREDLYYRLKVISIQLPALRERMEDLPDLIDHFLVKYSDQNNKNISHVSEESMEVLKKYAWPGNIRELEHAIERAVAMTRTTILFPEDFPPELMRPSSDEIDDFISEEKSYMGGHSLEDLEKNHILKVLQETQFNKSRASEVLGIDRATLYRKAQRYGIELRGKL